MTVHGYNDEDHWPVVLYWMEERGLLDQVEPDTFSPFGVVACDEDGPIMMVFVYLALGCQVCFLERLISRPGIGGVTARKAGRACFEYLRDMAKIHGYRHAYAHLDDSRLEPQLVELGFQTAPGSGKLMHTQL